LGLDRHRDDPQRDPVQLVDDRDEQPQPGLAGADDPAEAEQHAPFVLPDDPDREGQDQQDHGRDDHDDGGKGVH
jgi:hypothetical protein